MTYHHPDSSSHLVLGQASLKVEHAAREAILGDAGQLGLPSDESVTKGEALKVSCDRHSSGSSVLPLFEYQRRVTKLAGIR